MSLNANQVCSTCLLTKNSAKPTLRCWRCLCSAIVTRRMTATWWTLLSTSLWSESQCISTHELLRIDFLNYLNSHFSLPSLPKTRRHNNFHLTSLQRTPMNDFLLECSRRSSCFRKRQFCILSKTSARWQKYFCPTFAIENLKWWSITYLLSNNFLYK